MKPISRNYFNWPQTTTNHSPDMVRSPEGVMVQVQRRSRRGRKPSQLISQPLRDIRLSRRMTLEELADISQLSPSYISRLESGGRRLNADILNRLSKALQCSPNDLLTDTNSWGQKATIASSYLNQGVSANQPTALYPNVGASPALNTESQLVVYGSLQAAVPIDFSRPIGIIQRPPSLIGIPGAYAILVSDDSLAPRYNRGDCLLVQPGRPLTTNASAVVITTNNQVIIGEFVAWHNLGEYTPPISNTATNDGQMVLEIKQHNNVEAQDTPEGKVILQENQILSTAKVVGTIEG